MSRVMRKPAFCICKNKDADKLPVYTMFPAATAATFQATVDETG